MCCIIGGGALVSCSLLLFLIVVLMSTPKYHHYTPCSSAELVLNGLLINNVSVNGPSKRAIKCERGKPGSIWSGAIQADNFANAPLDLAVYDDVSALHTNSVNTENGKFLASFIFSRTAEGGIESVPITDKLIPVNENSHRSCGSDFGTLQCNSHYKIPHF